MQVRSFAAAAAVTLVLAAVLTPGCGGAVAGSGTVVTKKVAAPAAFASVRGEGAFELALRRSTGAELTVEADDNLHELLRTEVKDGILRIWTDGSWTSKNPFRVTVHAPSFSGLSVDGTVRGSADSLVAEGGTVVVSATGACKVEIDAVDCKSLRIAAQDTSRVKIAKSAPEFADVSASGSAVVLLHATCEEAKVRAEGAASVGDANFKAKRANVIVTGTSRVDLDVSEKLHADATGSSLVTYGGDPEVKGGCGAAAAVEQRAAPGK